MADDQFERLFLDTRLNASIGWVLVGVFVLVLIESLLDMDLLWIIFSTAILTVVVIPPVAAKSPQVMMPWELLTLASIPVIIRAIEISVLANTFATYLATAAFALLVVAQLHVFAKIRVTRWFAIVVVVMTTLAAAGAWAIVRWNLDRMTGSSFLTDNAALMVEFGWVTIAGLAAGVLFEVYFRPRTQQLRKQLRGVLPG